MLKKLVNHNMEGMYFYKLIMWGINEYKKKEKEVFILYIIIYYMFLRILSFYHIYKYIISIFLSFFLNIKNVWMNF
jgi:hypothetical protein